MLFSLTKLNYLCDSRSIINKMTDEIQKLKDMKQSVLASTRPVKDKQEMITKIDNLISEGMNCPEILVHHALNYCQKHSQRCEHIRLSGKFKGKPCDELTGGPLKCKKHI